MDALLNNPWFQANGWMFASALVGCRARRGSFYCRCRRSSRILAICWATRTPSSVNGAQELRAGNFVVPLVRAASSKKLLVSSAGAKRASLEILRSSLVASREKLPWKPEEFVAAKWIEGDFVWRRRLSLCLWFFGWTTFGRSCWRLVSRSLRADVAEVGPRPGEETTCLAFAFGLPFAVDLIALTMEAGGGFQECLQTAVEENGDHPLTDELAEVLRQISLGRPRHEALRCTPRPAPRRRYR